MLGKRLRLWSRRCRERFTCMQLAPQVLPVAVTERSQRWMPEDPESNVSQSHVATSAAWTQSREYRTP